MSKRTNLSVALLAIGVAVAASEPAMAGLLRTNMPEPGTLLQLADARSYHHCHNMPRRIRCHGKQRLPVNWPPNTNTPGTSSLREKHADKSGTCSGNRHSWFCRR